MWLGVSHGILARVLKQIERLWIFPAVFFNPAQVSFDRSTFAELENPWPESVTWVTRVSGTLQTRALASIASKSRVGGVLDLQLTQPLPCCH